MFNEHCQVIFTSPHQSNPIQSTYSTLVLQSSMAGYSFVHLNPFLGWWLPLSHRVLQWVPRVLWRGARRATCRTHWRACCPWASPCWWSLDWQMWDKAENSWIKSTQNRLTQVTRVPRDPELSSTLHRGSCGNIVENVHNNSGNLITPEPVKAKRIHFSCVGLEMPVQPRRNNTESEFLKPL